jgi:hypothetical protein
MWKAIGVGAVSAVALGFLFAVVYGSIFGARVPWGDEQVGMAGAQNAVSNLTFPPLLLALAVVGALIGIGVRYARQSHASVT